MRKVLLAVLVAVMTASMAVALQAQTAVQYVQTCTFTPTPQCSFVPVSSLWQPLPSWITLTTNADGTGTLQVLGSVTTTGSITGGTMHAVPSTVTMSDTAGNNYTCYVQVGGAFSCAPQTAPSPVVSPATTSATSTK